MLFICVRALYTQIRLRRNRVTNISRSVVFFLSPFSLAHSKSGSSSIYIVSTTFRIQAKTNTARADRKLYKYPRLHYRPATVQIKLSRFFCFTRESSLIENRGPYTCDQNAAHCLHFQSIREFWEKKKYISRTFNVH